jgi:hypothetical protein
MNAFLGGKLPMKRFRGQMLDSDRGLLDEIEESITIPEWPGVPEWRGRFWLPESSRIQPGGGSGPIRDVGRPAERIAAPADLGATGAARRGVRGPERPLF